MHIRKCVQSLGMRPCRRLLCFLEEHGEMVVDLPELVRLAGGRQFGCAMRWSRRRRDRGAGALLNPPICRSR